MDALTFSHRVTMQPSTMILRFRDLSTAEGDTLRLHADEIAEHGHVWWGWWAKAGERVPAEAFGELLKQARSGAGLPVWLFDSGRSQLFRANLRDIHWDPGGEAITAPENGSATPDYYNQGGTARYPAWFRLTDISTDASDATVVQEHSYVQVDEFFESRSSRYSAFYGKQVRSLEELRQQERTIWFVREVRPEDATHEIRLLDSHRISPSHFPEQYQQSPSLNLLWLSDVHFSSTGGHHGFPLDAQPSRKPLWNRIQHACNTFDVRDIGGIIVSGDFTWRAAPEEFAHASTLLRRLQSWSGVENYQVAVCPGNHDVAFAADPASKGADVVNASETATRAYSDFYADLFYLAPNQVLSCGRRYLLGAAIPVEVVCLNSNMLEQQQGVFQGHGFVGEDQLIHAEKEMGWDKATSEPLPIRIAVVHHHLVPVTYRDQPAADRSYSTTLDAEALTRWLLRHRVCAVLHGHMHSPFHTTIERPIEFGSAERHRLHVFGMGSSGVELGHLGEEKKNLFGVMRLSRDRLTMTYYSVDSTNPPTQLGVVRVDP